MPTDTSVKFLHSAMTGAPALTGQAGSLIALLDACLVNGFGAGGVDSIVIAGGVATVTRSAGHPFEVGSVALIAGATVTGGVINGEQKVTAVTTTTYQFDATGIANQAATGAITHKVAPAGWAKPYAGTNLAAYRSVAPETTGCLLRVDDTGTVSARVVGYESMSDINTGVGLFPSAAQFSGGGYWTKAHAADANARPWMVFADARFFYVAVASNSSYPAYYVVHSAFGDFLSSRVGPAPYDCLLFSRAGVYASWPTTQAEAGISQDASNDAQCVAPRGYSGLGSAATLARRAVCWTNGGASGFSGGTAFPDPGNGALWLNSMVVIEGSVAVRGTLPGLGYSPQAIGGSAFAPRSVTTGLDGRRQAAVPSGNGVVFFDVTGPWR